MILSNFTVMLFSSNYLYRICDLHYKCAIRLQHDDDFAVCTGLGNAFVLGNGFVLPRLWLHWNFASLDD